jgi:predicted dehydrogenase/acetyltransferase-like isoleucine patch superfamily enzyme
VEPILSGSEENKKSLCELCDFAVNLKKENTMNTTPNIAVIGSGYWGKNLVRNYYNIGALKLICDKNPTLLEQYNEQYPDVETCLALNDVISRDDIEGLVIATPAETHYTLAKEGLLAGKHVYVEKPLVLDEEEGEELIELASKYNKTLMVGHLLQYHPVFARLKDLALSGELGKINYIYSNRLNLGKIRREENILWSFAPHDISMILALACEEPEKVYATGGNYLHKQIADVTTTHLEFPSGLRAHIFVSWLHPFKEQKLVVVGDRKMAVFDDTQPWEDKLLLYPHKIKWKSNIPVPEKAEPERLDIPEAEPLRLECEHFLNSFINGKRPQTDGEEGLRVLKILNAAQRSLDSNGCNVSLQSPALPDTRNLAPETFFVHESAYIDENVNIGKGTKIWHFSHILKNCNIGETCNIGQNVVIGPDVCIGKQCKIQNNVSVYKGVTIEDGVFCGPSMVFTNIYNPRAQIVKMDQVRPTLVKQGATFGANCTIICGTTIGRYAFIGAGAVVNKNVPDYALVVGNPAKQIGWACECGERLSDGLECMVCSKKYQKQENAGLIETPNKN